MKLRESMHHRRTAIVAPSSTLVPTAPSTVRTQRPRRAEHGSDLAAAVGASMGAAHVTSAHATSNVTVRVTIDIYNLDQIF